MDILENGLKLGLINSEDVKLIKDMAFEDEDFLEYSMDYIFIVAVENNRLNMVKYLVSEGADVTADDNDAITYAGRYGYLEMTKYLVENGADVTAQDNATVIWASYNGCLNMVKYLVENGADISDQDNWSVCMASENGQLETVKYLVKVGADVTARDNYAIRMASRNGHLKVVEFLVENGADVDELTPEHKLYFQMKRAYSKWRRVYLRNWIRKVLIPLYYSPQFQGGIQAKKDLQAVAMYWIDRSFSLSSSTKTT